MSDVNNQDFQRHLAIAENEDDPNLLLPRGPPGTPRVYHYHLGATYTFNVTDKTDLRSIQSLMGHPLQQQHPPVVGPTPQITASPAASPAPTETIQRGRRSSSEAENSQQQLNAKKPRISPPTPEKLPAIDAAQHLPQPEVQPGMPVLMPQITGTGQVAQRLFQSTVTEPTMPVLTPRPQIAGNNVAQHLSETQSEPTPTMPVLAVTQFTGTSENQDISMLPVEPLPSTSVDTRVPIQDTSDPVASSSTQRSSHLDELAAIIRRNGGSNFPAFLQCLGQIVPESADLILAIHSNILAAKTQQAQLNTIIEISLDQLFRIMPQEFSESYTARIRTMLERDTNPSPADSENMSTIQQRTRAIEGYNPRWENPQIVLPFPDICTRVMNRAAGVSEMTGNFKDGHDKRNRIIEALQLKVATPEDQSKVTNLLNLYEYSSLDDKRFPEIADKIRMELLGIVNQVGDEKLTKGFNDAFLPEVTMDNGSSAANTSSRIEEIDETVSSRFTCDTTTTLGNECRSTTNETRQVKAEEKSISLKRPVKKRRNNSFGWSKRLPKTPEKKRSRAVESPVKSDEN